MPSATATTPHRFLGGVGYAEQYFGRRAVSLSVRPRGRHMTLPDNCGTIAP
jgi:hypothetical protein